MATPMTPREDQIKHMVSRFLGWKLPENFNPDCGISFKRDYNTSTPWPAKHEPVGTNLFDGAQAEAMVRHMLEGLPIADPNVTPREAGEAAFYECEGNNEACLKAAFDAYEAACGVDFRKALKNALAAMSYAVTFMEGDVFEPKMWATIEATRFALSKAKEA